MKPKKSTVAGIITWLAFAGNVLFVLWILYNGINEGFRGTLLEKISYISLMGLLLVNSVLLIRPVAKSFLTFVVQ